MSATRLIRSTALAVAATLLLLAASSGAAAAQEAPDAVLQAYLDAQNAGDLDAAMALLADDATYVIPPCVAAHGPQGCTGPDQVRMFVAADIADHISFTVLNISATASSAAARMEIRLDRVTALGFERILTDLTVEVANGQITSWNGVLDLSDEQTAGFVAAFSAGPPPAAAGNGGQAASSPALMPVTLVTLALLLVLAGRYVGGGRQGRRARID